MHPTFNSFINRRIHRNVSSTSFALGDIQCELATCGLVVASEVAVLALSRLKALCAGGGRWWRMDHNDRTKG